MTRLVITISLVFGAKTGQSLRAGNYFAASTKPYSTATPSVYLGCGPGWSTRLLQRVLASSRTIGLDASASFIAEADHERTEGLEFAVWDVTQTQFPVPAPHLLLAGSC